jgi:uncharacterized repeat protein (TIGR03803 family)
MKRILLLTLLGLIFYTQNAKAQGQIWSTIAGGGEYGLGAFFKLNGDGTGFSEEYSVPIDANNLGFLGSGEMVLSKNGKIYGTTNAGGANNKGVIFELDPATGVYLKKLDFSKTFGFNPSGKLIEANGKIYGSTSRGGIYDRGIIYEFNPVTGVGNKKIDLNEYFGLTDMILMEGKLVGVLSSQTPFYYPGIIFQMDLESFQFSVLADFSELSYGYPFEISAGNNGKLYGRTSSGGLNNFGVLFEFDPTSKVISKKVDFGNETGVSPFGGLTLCTNGKFYGFFYAGGDYDAGTLIEYDPNTSTFVKKLDLPRGRFYNSIGAGTPKQVQDTKLYGISWNGGDGWGSGSIYEYDIETNQFQEKHSFYQTGEGGFSPANNLLDVGDGILFGITLSGGSNYAGTIFQYDVKSSSYTKRFDFTGQVNGAYSGTLTPSSVSHKLYGLTDSGGAKNRGVLYEYDPITKVYTKKLDLEYWSTGAFYGLTEGSNGRLYWLSGYAGQDSNYGAIFEFDPATGVSTKKYSFQGGVLGWYPNGKLLLASNNKFYGTTNNGNNELPPIIFEYDPLSGVFVKKIDLPLPSVNGQPTGKLMQASSGKIYGTTAAYNNGSKSTVFEYDLSSNLYNQKIEFSSNEPPSSVVAVGNKLVITTAFGAAYSWGALYDYDLTSGQLTKNLDFSYDQEGGAPNGLVASNNGKVYGCAQRGGLYDGGTIFEFDPSNRNFRKIVDLRDSPPRDLTFVPTNLTPPEPQTIAFGTIPTKTYFDPPFNLATTSSVGLPITYTSSNPNVAKITGSQVTIMGAGSTTITATQPGNGYYSAATPVQQTLTVNKATQTITFNAIADKVPSTTTFNLDAVSTSGLAINYAISNLAVATITGNVVTVLAEGSTTITATQPGNSIYSAALPVQRSFSVGKLNQTISFEPLPVKLKGDPSFTLTASASSGLPVTFASSDASIATVTDATVTILRAGTVSITASQLGNLDYYPATSLEQSLVIEIPAKGQIWGVADGGSFNAGLIFSANGDGTGYRVRKEFINDSPRPGDVSDLTPFNGKLYGTTAQGGATNEGTLFEYDPSTKQYSKKADFGGVLGKFTYQLTVASNGKLYGVTSNGGVNDWGTIYELDPTTGVVTKKIDLSGSTGGYGGGLIQGNNGNLYGFTQSGGPNTNGTLIEYNPTTNSINRLFGFGPSTNLYGSFALALHANGRLYGITYNGANGSGALFEFDPLLSKFTLKISFDSNEYPGSKIFSVNDKIYGATGKSFFEYDPNTGIFIRKITINPNVEYLRACVVDDGKLYLTAALQDYKGVGGRIIEYNLTTGISIDKFVFNEEIGTGPVGLTNLNGQLFGATYFKAEYGLGSVYSFNPVTSLVAKEFDMVGALNGSGPTDFVAMPNGKLYGITRNGGNNNFGILYEYNPSTNVFVKKIDFDSNSGTPLKSLTPTSRGTLLGSTFSGGVNDMEMLFEFDPISGDLTKKKDFSDQTGREIRKLVEFSKDVFYGVTRWGGENGKGVLFKYNLVTNEYTKKYDFDGANGEWPSGSLTIAKNGKLYGVTAYGGSNQKGAIFQFDPVTEVLTKKYDLNNDDGAYPFNCSLLSFSNGKLYGLLENGGSNGNGTLFEFDPSNDLFKKKIDFDYNTIGSRPQGLLLPTSTGKLYGTATSVYGGEAANRKGTFFEFNPATGNFVKKLDFNGLNGQYPNGVLTYLKESQTITFDKLQSKSIVDASFDLTATSSTDLPVSYTSSDPTIASITGNKVTVLKSGTVTITASQAGDAGTYPAEEVKQSLIVKQNQTITFGTLANVVFGVAPFDLSAVSSSGLAVNYTSSDVTIASINGKKLTILKAGSVTITASQLGDESFSAALEVHQELTISKATPVVTWNNPTEISYGTSLSTTQLNATSTTDGTFAYSPAIGTKLNAGSNQSLSVTFTPTDAINFNSANKQVTITVNKATPVITWNNPTEIVYGTSLSATQLNAASTTDGTFTYLPAIGTKLNAGSNQSLSVTFTPTDAANFNLATKQVTITVSKATPVITWNNPTEIVYGTSLSATQLNATSTTEGTFTYSPTSGTKLNAGSSQSLSVTFTPTDAANFNSATKQVTITVNKATPVITWNNPTEIAYGTNLNVTQLNATSTTDGTLAYSPAIGTKLNAGSNQSLSVTFTPTDAANYNSATKQVAIAVSKATPNITWSNPTEIVYGTSLSATQLNATSTTDGTFTYSPAIGTRLNAGSNQSVSVTFTPTDAANYTTASKQVTISVAKASQQLTFLQLPDKLFGSGVIELTATATSGLPVKFSFSSDKISINETQVTLLKAGRVKILASQSGNDNFLAAVSSEQSFCIKPIKPIIEAPILSGSGFILTSNSTTGNQWFLNDKLLPGATSQTLNATESGTYKLQVSADDCASDFSLDKALVVTGDLQDDLSKIELYPNPVTDWLTIKLGEESIKKEISIVDLTGRQMVQKDMYGSEAQINVSDYSQGIYLLKVSSSTTTRIIKFEKQQ